MTNYKNCNAKSSPKKLNTSAETLDSVARNAIRLGLSDEASDMTQELRVLSRLCAARGGKIPIYKVQHAPPPSMSFISEVGRRKTTLNREWGYDIRQEFQEGNSVWWIVMGTDGLPVIDWTAPMRTGKKPVQNAPVYSQHRMAIGKNAPQDPAGGDFTVNKSSLGAIGL